MKPWRAPSGAAFAGALLTLAGCANPPPAPESSVGAPPSPAAEAAPAGAVAPKDACGAAEAQHLVGRPRSEIPVALDPSRQRVACTTCPVTQDYRPDRLNVFFDAETGIVREVRCG